MGKKRSRAPTAAPAAASEQGEGEAKMKPAPPPPGVAIDLPVSRIKAICRQDKELGALSKDAIDLISGAVTYLIKDLVEGAAEKADKKKGAETVITPEHIREYVLSSAKLGFLRKLVEKFEDPSFLDTLRAKASKARSEKRGGKGGGATGKKKHKFMSEVVDEEGQGKRGEQDHGLEGGAKAGGAAVVLQEDYDDDEDEEED